MTATAPAAPALTRTAAPSAASSAFYAPLDGPEWWTRPFRIFQTNIREVDLGLDVERNVRDIVDFDCNVWLLNAGGIVSHYPSKLPHQHPSSWLKDRANGDLLNDAIEEAHKHGVRVVARCDFSKVHRDVFEEHPD